MTSSSTGAPSGRLATPYIKRQGLLALPRTSCSSADAARAFPSTCSVNRGGVQNLVCLVHRSSFLTIKPDVLQRDNWTKVLATLGISRRIPWRSTIRGDIQPLCKTGRGGDSDRSPIAAGRFRQNIHELKFIDPVLCRNPCLLGAE